MPHYWSSLEMACSQAQRLVDGKSRPVILHGYGGAKKEMPDSLAALAKFGWIPMAAAMVGSTSSPPLWTGQDWRPILGTSVDTRILPPHLSDKERLLLLSQWIRTPRDDLHIRHATNSWLSPEKVQVALGPDCDLSPHPVRGVSVDTSLPYIDMLLGPQKPARGQSKEATKQEESEILPGPEEVLVTLRLQVDSCGPSDVTALVQILLGGTPISCRNRHLWVQAVQDHFDDVPLCVPSCQLLQFVCVTALQLGCNVYLATPQESCHGGDLEALRQGTVPFPESGVHVHIRPTDAVVGSTAGDSPQFVNIDCTGLGGHDLGGFKDYDICLRTDKHGQSIYGPSVTPLQSPGRDGTHQVTLVALGGSKAMHEFLVLHYLATDSAWEWDVFLDSCLKECTWVRAGSRRALALHMYNKCHIAPSHRRFAHPSWIAGMKLMLDLLIGARKHRYLGRRPANPRPAEVYVRGFSAGSCSGICLLHLLWNMPHVQVGGILGGISCPPGFATQHLARTR